MITILCTTPASSIPFYFCLSFFVILTGYLYMMFDFLQGCTNIPSPCDNICYFGFHLSWAHTSNLFEVSITGSTSTGIWLLFSRSLLWFSYVQFFDLNSLEVKLEFMFWHWSCACNVVSVPIARSYSGCKFA